MTPEDTLRKLFDDLKRQDAAEAPLFHQCLPHAKKPARRCPTIWILLQATAAMALLIAAVASFFHFLGERHTLPENHFEEWAALSSWQPSSDQLVAQNPALPGNQLTAPTDSIFENTSTTDTPNQSL